MSDTFDQIIEADLTWIDGQFRPDIRIAVDEECTIQAVGELNQSPTLRLPGEALLPGFINAHSHAFQRGLRGKGETFPEGAGSFWTWREAMYELVQRMDEHGIYTVSKQAFDEMRDAGITTVGEFHYLHHNEANEGFALDEVILRAAADAGIRIVLLQAYYNTGGIDEPLKGGQLRFNTPSIETYWAQFDQLRDKLQPPLQTLGVVAHSIRAAPIEHIKSLHEEADRRGLVFHMHVEEQPAEIEASLRKYSKTPLALLNEELELNPLFTAVHCTHTATTDMADLIDAGGNICICPLTEANLGDGLANIPDIRHRGGHICLGTDSNARISMIEEMRWLEYGQRLARQQRGVCIDANDSIAGDLIETATTNGARSLGVRAGAIRENHVADFACIDLHHPALLGADREALATALICGGENSCVTRTCVGGKWRQTVDYRT